MEYEYHIQLYLYLYVKINMNVGQTLYLLEIMKFHSLGYSRKKNQTGGAEDKLFWKPPWNFLFFYFISGNSRQNKVPPLEILQNCFRSPGNSKAKNQDPWKFHIIFLATLGNSALFLINPPGNPTCYFFDTPRNSISLTPLFVFFWNSPLVD